MDNLFQVLDAVTVLVRIGLSMLLSGVLGFERTRKGRAAGFRTYMLVCISAAVIMMTAQFIYQKYGSTDISRLGGQVVTGIGFLGAGTILITGYKQVRGLTTAAGLFASACMGIAIGIGFYSGALMMCAAMFIVMTFFNYLQARWVRRSKRIQLYIVFENISNIGDFLELAHSHGIKVSDFETIRPEACSGVGAIFMLHFAKRMSHAEIIELLRGCKGLTLIEEI